MGSSRRVEKPWGFEIWWAVTDSYAGKILHVKQGHRLSLQYHQYKDESCYVLSGRVLLIKGRTVQDLAEREMAPGSNWRNRPGEIHTIAALEDSMILEASTSQLTDVVRLSDCYGRTSSTVAESQPAVAHTVPPSLIDKDHVAGRLSTSRREVAELIRQPGFPRPVGYFRGRLVWDESDIQWWLDHVEQSIARQAV
jgi:mannose-6-phosphate isomerase-like protein (cupin superfamily)/predicted DNA-binding transcriptional regulator AlpA